MTSNNGGFPVDRLDPAATAPDDTEGHRLASNDNETVVDEPDTEGHRLAANDNETIVDEPDTEGHRLAANDNETIVEGDRR